MILTVTEIRSLAMFAGLVLDKQTEYDDDELETEFTIIDCPPEGIKDDDGKVGHFRHLAHSTEYPEEGCTPLGAELTEWT